MNLTKIVGTTTIIHWCRWEFWYSKVFTYHSQALKIHAQIIQSDSMKTTRTVPGNMFISVFSTNLVLNVILFRAPMLREDASVNSLLCSNITLTIKYNLKNIGSEKMTSYGTRSIFHCEVFMSNTLHMKVWEPATGCIAHITSSPTIWQILPHDIVILQSSIQLSTTNNCKNKINHKVWDTFYYP